MCLRIRLFLQPPRQRLIPMFVSPGASYSYYVTALNADGEGAASLTVTAAVMPAAPKTFPRLQVLLPALLTLNGVQIIPRKIYRIIISTGRHRRTRLILRAVFNHGNSRRDGFRGGHGYGVFLYNICGDRNRV